MCWLWRPNPMEVCQAVKYIWQSGPLADIVKETAVKLCTFSFCVSQPLQNDLLQYQKLICSARSQKGVEELNNKITWFPFRLAEH